MLTEKKSNVDLERRLNGHVPHAQFNKMRIHAFMDEGRGQTIEEEEDRQGNGGSIKTCPSMTPRRLNDIHMMPCSVT